MSDACARIMGAMPVDVVSQSRLAASDEEAA